MITLIEAKNYRCLHYVCERLEPFHVLVGPAKLLFLMWYLFSETLFQKDRRLQSVQEPEISRTCFGGEPAMGLNWPSHRSTSFGILSSDMSNHLKTGDNFNLF